MNLIANALLGAVSLERDSQNIVLPAQLMDVGHHRDDWPRNMRVTQLFGEDVMPRDAMLQHILLKKIYGDLFGTGVSYTFKST